MTLSKNRKEALSKYDNEKSYSLEDASKIVKDISKLKFDPTVDIAVRLGVDPRKANQMVRGTVSLPHGTGKDVSVLVLCSPDKENEAKEAGADYVGLDEFIDKIKKGWTDVDVIIDAINYGHIYQYIRKPFIYNEMKEVLFNASKLYHLRKDKNLETIDESQTSGAE